MNRTNPRQEHGGSAAEPNQPRKVIRIEDLPDLAMGAAFLGTGGGGDPYVGRLMAEEALRQHGPIELLALDAVPDDAFIVPVGNMGAPTVLVEKIPGGEEPLAALEKLERHVGRRAFAIMPFEAGGVNSTLPLRIAAQRKLPVVDADGMGRAFPELQMETFNVYGVQASPVTIVSEHGDSVVIEAHSSRMAEWIARGATIRMGGQTSIAMYGMDGRTAKRVSIPGTMSLIVTIGQAMRHARECHQDPFAALIDALGRTHYGFARVLFGGKIVDVQRETRFGFALGHMRIAGLGNDSGQMMITFQNENLIARVGETVRAVVPDLICVLDSETAEPVTTERLRYGQRVTVMGVSVPSVMRTPEALDVFGPGAFGLDVPFTPIETLCGEIQSC